MSSRRNFLQSLGLFTGAVACGGPDQQSASQRLQPLAVTWDKAPCRFCGTGCGVEVGVNEGKVVAVRGDQASPVNRGLLCVKGYHLPGILYGKDRLTHPLLKQADGSYQKISWDEALDLVAQKYTEALATHGKDSVAVYGSGQWAVFDGYAALKWVKGGMRSNQLESNARLCMASAVGGFMSQFQSDEPMGCYEDLEAADDVVLWGNNMAEMHPILFSRVLESKRKRPGNRLIDISTRLTPTSDYADMHIEIRPGTDLALANGVLHLLLAKNAIDEAFIAENVVFKRGIEDITQIGYGAFGEQAERYTFQDALTDSSLADLHLFFADYTPAKVSEISGVPAQQIEALAEVYGEQSRNTLSLWCMGVNQHTRGTWMNNLINNLHLITGKICRPGSNPFSLTGQPSACGTAREVGISCDRLPADMSVKNPEHRAHVEELWGLPKDTISAEPGYHAVDMFRAFVRGDIKVMWIQCTNPFQGMPSLARYSQKRGAGQFLISSDIYPNKTTDQADLILPSAAWVEREGVFGNAERRTQQWNKMVDPPGEAKEDAWQIMEVAKRMKMGHLFPWPEDNWHEPMFEEYRRFGVEHGKDLASYEALKKTRGMIWPVVNGKETPYRYTAGIDPYVTKTKGAHFYKAKSYGEKAAFIARPYQPPAESPDADFPFWLCTGRVLEHWHTGTMTRRIKQLHQAVPNAYVEVNRADASQLGVKAGDLITIKSRRGELSLPVMIDGRGKPPRGVVFVPFFDEGLLVNLLTLDAMDNLSKEPDYKKCAVKLVRSTG
jgi:nitrate reductase (cytochrome)